MGARVYGAGARVYGNLVILVSAQVLLVLTLGLWTLYSGLTISHVFNHFVQNLTLDSAQRKNQKIAF